MTPLDEEERREFRAMNTDKNGPLPADAVV
jgi:hypothetical protein